MEKPSLSPEYKRRSRRKSSDPGMKKDSWDSTAWVRMDPVSKRRGATGAGDTSF